MMALAANQMQHMLPFDPTNSSIPYESDASVEESDETSLEDEDFDIIESEEPVQSEIVVTTTSTTPTLTANVPDTVTTTNTLITHSTSPAISQDRPSSPSLQDVPSLVLTFKSNTYCLFSPLSTSSSSEEESPEVLFADKLFLYKAPLQNLMFELKEHFSVTTDVSLDFPELQLSFGLNMIYAQKVTLAHVQLLTQGLENHVGKSIPFSAKLVEAPNSFLSQYNRLIELAQQMPSKSNVVFTSSSTGIPIPTTPTKSFDSAPSTNVPTSVQPSESVSSEQAEAEVEVEPEIEDVVETNAEENIETVEENANETSESYTESNENEFEPEHEPEPEVVEEDLIPVEDGSTSKAEEVLDEQTNSEDVEVEFDELNTELTVPDDVVYASSQKLHARRWDDDHRPDEVDELERKRQKFSNNEQEGGSTETTSNNQQEDESVTST